MHLFLLLFSLILKCTWKQNKRCQLKKKNRPANLQKMVIWTLKCSHWWLCHCRRNFTFRLNLYQNANAEWKRDTWEFFFVSFLSGLRKIIGWNGRKSAQTNFRKVQYQLHNKKNVSFPNRFAPPFLFVFIPFSFCVQREKKNGIGKKWFGGFTSRNEINCS